MAKVVRRVWKSGPRGVKKVAYGYTLQAAGKQERRFDAGWTRDDAQNELAKRSLEQEPATAPKPPMTLAQLVTEYLDFKSGKGKRSIRQDEQLTEKLKRGLGADVVVTEVTKPGRIRRTARKFKRPRSSGG